MVLARLPGWRWVKAAWLCPKPVRDFVYDRIAKNRYRIFGRYESCIVPGPEFRSRVLGRLPPGSAHRRAKATDRKQGGRNGKRGEPDSTG